MRPTRHHKRPRRSTRFGSAKRGGSRHGERARKAKPWIGANGVYVKSRSRKIPKKAPSALYEQCDFCASYAQLGKDEDPPTVWTCVIGCDSESARCVKCFPRTVHPRRAQLLPWDISHWGGGITCDAFEASLAGKVYYEASGGNFSLVACGVPSPRDRKQPWWENACTRDLSVFGSLCAVRCWQDVDRKGSQYRQLASVVRRIAKHQRVPPAEIRAALVEAELGARSIEIPRDWDRVRYDDRGRPTQSPSLMGLVDEAHYPSSALACAAISYLVRSSTAKATVGLSLAASKLAPLDSGTEDEMVIRAFLPRWVGPGGRVTDEVIDAAAAAWGAGQRALALRLVKRETTGRKRKTTGENGADSALGAPRRRKKKRRRGPSDRGRRK